MLSSILLRATPHDVRLVLIDPKQVELNHYESIPHLLTPVITNPRMAANALGNLVREMEQRYGMMSLARTRSLVELNRARAERGEPALPYILCVIDELADLMMVAPADVETAIIRLAQKARAVGIHLVLATQSPRVDVITGLIKANVPSRIAFAVSSQTDSRVILDQNGAESLLGAGDMLFAPMGSSRRSGSRAPTSTSRRSRADRVLAAPGRARVPRRAARGRRAERRRRKGEDDGFDPDEDPLLEDAIELVVEMGIASTSMLQRRMRLGYTRAGRLIDMLERRGIISGYEGSKPRQVLVSEADLPAVIAALGAARPARRRSGASAGLGVTSRALETGRTGSAPWADTLGLEMADIGATLREARMRAHLDIVDFEARTKIRAKYLRALEDEEWSLLPGYTFTKGFLRTYADMLGLDGRALVDEFKRQYRDPSELEVPPLSPQPPRQRRGARARIASRAASAGAAQRRAAPAGAAPPIVIAVIGARGAARGGALRGGRAAPRKPTPPRRPRRPDDLAPRRTRRTHTTQPPRRTPTSRRASASARADRRRSTSAWSATRRAAIATSTCGSTALTPDAAAGPTPVYHATTTSASAFGNSSTVMTVNGHRARVAAAADRRRLQGHAAAASPPAAGEQGAALRMSARAAIVVTGTEVLSGRVRTATGPGSPTACASSASISRTSRSSATARPTCAPRSTGARALGVDLVVTSGGSGPTADDLTATVVGEFCGREMVLDEALEERIAAIVLPLRAPLAASDRGGDPEREPQAGAGPAGRDDDRAGRDRAGARRAARRGARRPDRRRPARPAARAAADVGGRRRGRRRSPPRSATRRSTSSAMLRLYGLPESEIATTLRAAERGRRRARQTRGHDVRPRRRARDRHPLRAATRPPSTPASSGSCASATRTRSSPTTARRSTSRSRRCWSSRA